MLNTTAGERERERERGGSVNHNRGQIKSMYAESVTTCKLRVIQFTCTCTMSFNYCLKVQVWQNTVQRVHCSTLFVWEGLALLPHLSLLSPPQRECWPDCSVGDPNCEAMCWTFPEVWGNSLVCGRQVFVCVYTLGVHSCDNSQAINIDTHCTHTCLPLQHD